MLYSDGSYETELGEYVDAYAGAGEGDDFGIAPLLVAGALSIAKKIPLIGGLLGKGYDSKKWRDRSRRVQAAAAAGDLAALDSMGNVHSAWGSVYNPIRTAARQAAAAIRAAQAQAAKPGQATPGGTVPLPAPPPLVAPIPEPGAGAGPGFTLPSPIQQAIDQAGEAAGTGFRRGATPELPPWVVPAAIGGGVLLVGALVLASRPARSN